MSECGGESDLRRSTRLKQKSEEGNKSSDKVIQELLSEDIDDIVSAKSLYVKEAHKYFGSCKRKINSSPKISAKSGRGKKDSIRITGSQQTIQASFSRQDRPIGSLSRSVTLDDLSQEFEFNRNSAGLLSRNATQTQAYKGIDATFSDTCVSNSSITSFVSASEEISAINTEDKQTRRTHVNNIGSTIDKRSAKSVPPTLQEVIKRSISTADLTSIESASIDMHPNKDTERGVKEPSSFREMMDMMREEWKNVLAESMAKLKSDLQQDMGITKAEKEVVCNEITKIKAEQTKTQNEVKRVNDKVNGCHVQVSELISIVGRQDQIIQECKNEIENLRITSTNANMFIRGVSVKKNESIKEAIQNFFSHKMQVPEQIPIKSAFFIGKAGSGDRPIKVILANSQDRGKLIQYVKNLKGETNERGKSFSVEAELPPRTRAHRNRLRNIRKENSEKDRVDQFEMEMKDNNLIIEGKIYEKEVKPPLV